MSDSAAASWIPAGARRVTVLVVQDHPLLATEIARVLAAESDLMVAGISGNAADALKIVIQDKPDVVLMDFKLPDVSGPVAAGMILTAHPVAAVVFHSADDSEAALLDAIDAGASAYLTKDATPKEIVEAVRRAARREVLIPVALFARAIARQRATGPGRLKRERLLKELTPREFEVLKLMSEGLDTEGMAGLLEIAPHTIEWHVRHVIEKLEVHSKLQAVIAASREGLIDL